MKKAVLFTSALLIAIIGLIWYGCEPDNEESCLQDEICTAKYVTACCDDNEVCIYKYNGKEYTEDQKEELADDLGCASSALAIKSAGNENDLANVIAQLKALMVKVRKQIKSDK